MTDDPKIVPGTIPEFGQSTARPDTLEGVITSDSPSTNFSPLTDWEQENMHLLGKELTPLIEKSGNQYAKDNTGRVLGPLNLQLSSISELLPYTLTSLPDSTHQSVGVAQLHLQSPPTHLIRSQLEKIYGPELAQSGLYEATGLDTGVVKFDILAPYFPEIKVLSKLDGRFVTLINNPYLTLLAYPVESRPFFTGVINDSKSNITITDTPRDSFYHPLTLQHIFDYAKKVNQIPKVAEYMKLMNQLKEGK